MVVGGSYVGLEFAQMYRRFGSQVTIVEKGPRLIGREDEDVSAGDTRDSGAASRSPFASTRVHPVRTTRRPSRRRASIAKTGHPRSSDPTCSSPSEGAPTPMISTSTRPGVELDARGYIMVDDQLRTRVPGDLGSGRLQRQGGLYAYRVQRLRDRRRQLLDGEARRVSDRIPAYALYIDPPLGRVGLTEAKRSREGTGSWSASDP